MLHKETTGSDTSYIPNLLGDEEKIKSGNARLKYKMVTSMNIQT